MKLLKLILSRLELTVFFLPLLLNNLSCINNNSGTGYVVTFATPVASTTPVPTSTGTSGNIVIASVNVLSSSSSGSSSSSSTTTAGVPQVQIYFNTSGGNIPISQYCSAASTGASNTNPCLCQFRWNEINQSTKNSISIPRVFQTAVVSVQPSVLVCNAPDVYNTEIQVGTQLSVTVVPASGNSNFFQINPFIFTKSNGIVAGSFQDSTGQSFDNIVHYACYGKQTRGLSIKSKIQSVTNSSTGIKVNGIFGSQFCVGSATSSSDPSCAQAGGLDNSAQSYFFNLYIRNSEKGDINQSNSAFVCPTVQESLNSNGTIGTQNQFWPQDMTYALSIGPTTTFNIGVEAFTKISGSNDPTGAQSFCNSTTTSGTSSLASSGAGANSLILSCLGFAASPNPDGTCPAIKDATGLTRPTFRLRRYRALYPKFFNADGTIPNTNSQSIDLIYVLDRPVKSQISTDPTKPFTMLGPKPCPFAFFDRHGVSTALGSNPYGFSNYVASSNIGWSGKNVDGIELPNIDGLDFSGAPSCSTTLPVLSQDKSRFLLTTVNINSQYTTTISSGTTSITVKPYQHVFIRPIQAFLPHYEEDLVFKACAPQASPMMDAPLHFSRDPVSKNVAWCTEAYPTQNPNIAQLDPQGSPVPIPTATPGVMATPSPTGTITPAPIGRTSPYTSHLVKNSFGQACTATSITVSTQNYALYPSPSPNGGYARHSIVTGWDVGTASQTCDRTVSSQGLDWSFYPLLAPAADVETAIVTDTSYWCTITFDNNAGRTNQSTPSDGCCDKNVVFVTKTSAAAVSAAHLEPTVACGLPNY